MHSVCSNLLGSSRKLKHQVTIFFNIDRNNGHQTPLITRYYDTSRLPHLLSFPQYSFPGLTILSGAEKVLPCLKCATRNHISSFLGKGRGEKVQGCVRTHTCVCACMCVDKDISKRKSVPYNGGNNSALLNSGCPTWQARMNGSCHGNSIPWLLPAASLAQLCHCAIQLPPSAQQLCTLTGSGISN